MKLLFIAVLACVFMLKAPLRVAHAASDTPQCPSGQFGTPPNCTPLFSGCDSSTTTAAVCQDKDKTQEHTNNSFYGKNGILTRIVGLYALATGVVSVIMIIVAGFKLVTSSGDPNNIKSAKNTITFAIAGLMIAALAGAIVQFVLNKL